MNHLLRKVFERRGFDDAFFKQIENHKHDTLKDIDLMCDMLYNLYTNQVPITFLPDFDMDGVASGIVGFAGLSELGFNVSLFIPDPKEGYSFNSAVIDRLLSDYPNTKCIITADNGIGACEGVAYAQSKGIMVLITDHHKQDPMDAINNTADCIVNPMRIDESYSHPAICGAYVIYQVLEHYATKFCNGFMLEQIRRLSAFAGIGTVSDMMPVFYENRKLIRDAMYLCRYFFDRENADSLVGCDVYRRAFLGLHNMLKAFLENGKIKEAKDIDEMFFGFYVAPTFNSVKRLDGDMSKVFGVFFGPNTTVDMEYLLSMNEERKRLVNHYYDVIMLNPCPFAPYVYVCDAPLGILGLLATKIMADTGLPTFVVKPNADGSFNGSGRAPDWFKILSEFNSNDFWARGHEGSCGVAFTDLNDMLNAFHFVTSRVTQLTLELGVSESPIYDFCISTLGDGDIDIDTECFKDYLRDLKRFKPFGTGLKEPVAELKFAWSDASYRIMGSDGQHLKITLQDGFEVLCWNQAPIIDELDETCVLHVVGRLGKNVFNEVVTLNFMGNIENIEQIDAYKAVKSA